MNESETNYLNKYRDLFMKQAAIKSRIEQVKKVCKSLENWQETASGIVNSLNSHAEWTDESLSSSMNGVELRGLLADFYRSKKELRELHGTLKPDERSWLPAPEILG